MVQIPASFLLNKHFRSGVLALPLMAMPSASLLMEAEAPVKALLATPNPDRSGLSQKQGPADFLDMDVPWGALHGGRRAGE